MAMYGGLSPNCTDYCPDYWYYDIVDNWWAILYGEWWGVVREWQVMWDYAQFGQSSPIKRWGHAAVMVGDYMFILGGHTNGSATACCGYDYVTCQQPNSLIRYEHDLISRAFEGLLFSQRAVKGISRETMDQLCQTRTWRQSNGRASILDEQDGWPFRSRQEDLAPST